MNVREYVAEDYPTLCEWWRGHDWEPVAEALLPRGFVVEGLAAGFIYVDDLGVISMMEWVVTNPNEINGIERYKALKTIIQACTDYAKERGVKLIYTTSNSEKLIKIYEKGGFMVSEDATLMFKAVV